MVNEPHITGAHTFPGRGLRFVPRELEKGLSAEGISTSKMSVTRTHPHGNIVLQILYCSRPAYGNWIVQSPCPVRSLISSHCFNPMWDILSMFSKYYYRAPDT